MDPQAGHGSSVTCAVKFALVQVQHSKLHTYGVGVGVDVRVGRGIGV